MDITNYLVSQRDEALLFGDHNSYRAQCSKRIHIIRKRLGLTTRRGHKYSTKAPVSAEDVGKNHEFVHLLLLSSERAWANALHMKTSHSTDDSNKAITGSTRSQIISRLQKSSIYAAHLIEILKNRSTTHATDSDIIEARAYASFLLGALNYEKQKWDTSLKEYSTSRVIYTALGTSTKKDMYKDLVENIDTFIRFAAHRLQLPRTKALSAIAIDNFPRSDTELVSSVEKLDPNALEVATTGVAKRADGQLQDTPKTITWRKRTVEIADASIGEALAAVSAAESELSKYLSSSSEAAPKDKASAYDNIILASQDAVDATKSAIDEVTADGIDQGDKRMQSLQVTRTAVNYDLVEWRVGRNRILCGPEDGSVFEPEHGKTPKKHRKDGKPWTQREEGTGRKLSRLRERVVLYDAILQSLDSVKELPGVAADTEFVTELEGKRAYFQALRCLAIARSQSVLSNPTNCLALLNRALSLSTQFPKSQSTSTSSIPKLAVTPTQSKSLYDLLQSLVLQYHGLVELQSLAPDTSNPTKAQKYTPPLINNLNLYPPGGVDLANLVTYPPRVEPIPVKPLFLDLAWNYIDYPGRAKKGVVENGVNADGAKSEESKQEDKAQGRKGWFGFGR